MVKKQLFARTGLESSGGESSNDDEEVRYPLTQKDSPPRQQTPRQHLTPLSSKNSASKKIKKAKVDFIPQAPKVPKRHYSVTAEAATSSKKTEAARPIAAASRPSSNTALRSLNDSDDELDNGAKEKPYQEDFELPSSCQDMSRPTDLGHFKEHTVKISAQNYLSCGPITGTNQDGMPYRYRGLIFSRRYKKKKNGQMTEFHYKGRLFHQT